MDTCAPCADDEVMGLAGVSDTDHSRTRHRCYTSGPRGFPTRSKPHAASGIALLMLTADALKPHIAGPPKLCLLRKNIFSYCARQGTLTLGATGQRKGTAEGKQRKIATRSCVPTRRHRHKPDRPLTRPWPAAPLPPVCPCYLHEARWW